MIIKTPKARKESGDFTKISEYLINPKFSGALIETREEQGIIKSIKEDRIYFIIDGRGKFIIENEEIEVTKNDLFFIPKNTSHNIIGRMRYFLLCTPECNSNNNTVSK